jgi:hypothetical protein
MEEITDCWDADPVAQQLLGDLTVLRLTLLKTVKSSELGANTLFRLKGFCRAVLTRSEEYSALLLSTLEDVVIGTADLNQKERITSQIDRLTGLYTTHLLNLGYSPTYLFNRADMFFRINNYGGRTFQQQFRTITGRLQSQRLAFDVYYGIHTSEPELLLAITDELGVEFLTDLPAQVQAIDREKINKDIDVSLFVKATITSTDHVSAAMRTKERIDRFLDAATSFELSTELQISASCIVIGPNHVYAVEVDMLLAFMSSEGGSSFSHPHISIRSVFKNLDDSAKDQLGRSLRYLRLARYSVSLEQKLLNLWIALECLFVNREANILNNILEYVPQLYSTAGLVRRVAYLRDLLVANRISTTAKFQADICIGVQEFDESVTNGHVFALLRDETAAIELFNSIATREHLKFKLMQIFTDIKDNRAIAARIERSEKDVNRQLRRIYFLRNKIAHTGHFQGVRPQLVTHLLDYLAICYRAISSAATHAKAENKYSIAELFTAAQMGSDVVRTRSASKDAINTLDQMISIPIV